MKLSLGLRLAARSGAPLSPILPVAAPTASGYFADRVAPYAAYGPQRVVSGYSGPLFTLRRSDGAVLDVLPQAAGDYPDYAAIDLWAGGDIPTVAMLHDQSGNGRHMEQSAPAKQPLFDARRQFGNLVPICFDGYGRTNTATNPHRERTLSVGSLTGLDGYDMSAFMAMQPQTSYNSTGHWNGGAEDGLSSLVETMHGLSPNTISVRALNKNKSRDVGPMVRMTPNTFGFTASGDGICTIFGNGNSSSVGGYGTPSMQLSRLTLGKSLFGGSEYYGAFRFFGIVYYNSGLSAQSAEGLIASMNTAFGHGNGFGTAPEYNVVFLGDSIMEGTGSRALANMPGQLDALLTKPRRIYNMSVHGEKMSSAFTQREARYTPTFVSGIPNVAFLQYGTNDLASETAANLYANTATPFVAFLKGLGFKVVICTILPRTIGAWTPEMEAERVAYNDAVRGNAAGADAVLDLATNPTMGNGNEGNATLYPDGLHPSSLGYRYLAGAPSGTYAGPQTYYTKLSDTLRATALGASYVP
jgi:lysophospholipase L1-like esterase